MKCQIPVPIRFPLVEPTYPGSWYPIMGVMGLILFFRTFMPAWNETIQMSSGVLFLLFCFKTLEWAAALQKLVFDIVIFR